ncbi:chymotrypsin-like elastase family member 3B isoform X2 [Hemicordylus capensis]|nr:chymotrypsin-like elastase family member 3B isoform X2 [Hemicordylus capensis]
MRVVNGEDAQPYSWPWQISLQIELGGAWYHNCGGTLITPDWVMTAGHCIMPYYNTRVVLGEYNLSVEEGPEQYIPVNPEDMYEHPDWDSSCLNCGNDIALIKLSRSAVLSDKVKLGCVPCEGLVLPNDYPCYLTGWGSLHTSGPDPDILQQALLPVVDHEHCTQPDWWGDYVNEKMVCAGGDIRAGCFGDSGGPLICQYPEDGKWYVHGVTSFVSGLGCDTLKKPTVFTRVSAFVSWLKEIINNH